MHLTILSRDEGVHSTRRLMEAARLLGHRVRVLDPLSLQLALGSGPHGIYAGEKALGRTDVVIPRFAQSINSYGLAVVNQFDLRGTPVLNDAQSIAQARNKMRLMQLLVHHMLPVPPTVIGRGANELRRMASLVGGFPVAVKLVEGADRTGVIVCETAQSMEATLEAVLSMGLNIIVQRYVAADQGRSLRALVVGGRLLAAVSRRTPGGRLRRTLGTAHDAKPTQLSAAQEQLALKAAQVVGLEVAAVDLLMLEDGTTQVFDLHSSPGLRDLEEATGQDLARPIVERAIEMAQQRRHLAAMDARGRSRPRGR